jgi:hypothetical protein
MPLELHRLKTQLDNLKVVLEDAIKNNSSFLNQDKILKQISEVERLIEQRKQYLKNQ